MAILSGLAGLGYTKMFKVYRKGTPKELLKKTTMPELMMGFQWQWRAGLINQIFFQCDVKIDIHFFVPCFLSGGTIIRQ